MHFRESVYILLLLLLKQFLLRNTKAQLLCLTKKDNIQIFTTKMT